MKTAGKIILWVVGVVIALLLAVTLAAGPVVTRYLNQNGKQLVGRRISVERVGINIFGGHVNVRNLCLYEDDGQTRFVGFDTLDVSAQLAPLTHKTLHIKHITLAGLDANIVQDGEWFNFGSLIDHFATGDKEKDTTPSEWVLKFYNTRISHATLAYDDRLNGRSVHLPDINMHVPGFVLGGSEDSEGGLSIAFAEGGTLTVDVGYDNSHRRCNVAALLDDFALKNVEPMMADLVNADSLGGSLTAHLKAEGSLDNLNQSRIGGTVALTDVGIGSNGNTLAALQRLQLAVGNIALDTKSIDIDSLVIDGLTAGYEQWDGHNTLSDLLAKEDNKTADSAAVAADTTMADSTVAEVFKIRMGRLAVTNSAITYSDHTLPGGSQITVSDIQIDATDLSTQGDNSARLCATLPGGGRLDLDWSGSISEWKKSQNAVLMVRGLDMRQLNPWLKEYTGTPVENGKMGLESRMSVADGKLNGRIKIGLNDVLVIASTGGNMKGETSKADHIGASLAADVTARGSIDNLKQSIIGGTVALTDVSIGGSSNTVASLQQLHVGVKGINLDKKRFDIDSIMVDGLTAAYEQWDSHNTLSDIAAEYSNDTPGADKSGTSANSGKAVQSTPPTIKVGRLTVKNSAIDYSDYTLPDECHITLSNIRFNATDINTKGDNKARLRATLPGGGQVMVNWNGNINNWKKKQDVTLSVRGLDMRQLSPWTVAYLGKPIDDGVFGLNSRLTITNSVLENQNKIDLYKVKVGDSRKEIDPEVKVPLKTALYLMKDKDDKILIDLPVNGNVDDPEFKYMKVVWKTLGNLLVKVATTPARALADALNIDSKDLEFLAIDPLQRGLTSEQYHQLSNIAATMQRDSLIVLTMERHMPEAENDSIERRYRRFDRTIRQYITEQGISERQLIITNAKQPADKKERTGYTIKMEIKIEE